MRCFIGGFAVMAVLVVMDTSLAVPITWSVEDGGNGHWYDIVYVEGGISWQDARDAASAAGGHLATIGSEAENDFVFQLAITDSRTWTEDYSGNTEGPWLGGFQPFGASEPAGDWAWVTGEPFSYTNWGESQPNNSDGFQDSLNFFGFGSDNPTPFWNDNGNPDNGYTPVTGYVVESVPEPSMFLLLSMMVAGLLMFMRRRMIA